MLWQDFVKIAKFAIACISGHKCTQLKNAKAPGGDNIPPEALKEGGPCTVEALHRILNFVWEKEVIPDDWKRGLLVKLTKKRRP